LKNFVNSNLIFFALFFLGCGSGDYTIDPNAGLESESGGTTGGTGGAAAQTFFTDNLWPIMKFTSGTGCANGGCHGNISASPQTFFKVDATSASNSWNWSGVRRKRVDRTTGFAGVSSVTLKARKDGGHNTFQNWSAAQKALLEDWVGLP
jgi:hypothetical protein